MRSKTFIQKINWREFSPAFIIVVNSITWYALIYAMFNASIVSLHLSTTETVMIFIVHYVGIAASAILGATLFPRARIVAILSWIIVGALMSGLLVTIPNNSTSTNALISLLLGISIGIGLPSCLAYFADDTTVENRGVHGGVTWSAVGFGILLLAVLISPMDSASAFMTLAIWRGLGLIFFFLPKKKKMKEKPELASSGYASILRRTDLILYLVPWIMLCLVNFIEAPIVENLFGNFYTFSYFIDYALTGVFALIGGLMADIVGRKRVVMTGFIVLGIEYAVFSIFYGMPFSWYIYAASDGIAWGMFAAVFFMTLWGDLAGTYEKEKYYLIGGLSYVLSAFLPIVVRPYVMVVPPVASFSLASFFLFLAVLPLMYAPETLPEKRIRERELRDYVEKAKKTKEKYT